MTAYVAAGQKPPKKIIWCSSPACATFAASAPSKRSRFSELSADLQRTFTTILSQSEGVSQGESTSEFLFSNIFRVVDESLTDRLYHDGLELLRSNLRNRSSLLEIHRNIESAIAWREWARSQYQVDELAYFDYIREVFHLEEDTQRLQGLNAIAQNAGWIFPYENICWVTERPTSLLRDDQGRLHSVNGPAVTYPDGWNVYAIHGVNLPPHVFESPDLITVDEIDSSENAEIRRVMTERYGTARYLRETGAQEISKDDYGVLYQRNIPGQEPLLMVKVINSTPERDGSAKEYFLRVPPTMTTAREAVAWTFGIPPEHYELEQES